VLRSSGELRARLGLTPVGDEVELNVIREGGARRVRVQIAPPQESADGDGTPVAQLPGLKVVEIERGSPLFQRLRGGGLVVSAVDDGSRVLQAGFRPGDIIYAVNRRRVQTLKEFLGRLRAAERGYAVSLIRGDFNLTIVVR
jgi:serine protease Do/serine protease DegQ